MSEKYVFSSEEEKIYQRIKRDVTKGITSVDDPVAIVLGGQPGSGKSNLYIIAKKRFNKNIAEIDCDNFREYHPKSEEYAKDPYTYGKKTNPFVSAISDRLVEELSDQKYNMIIESPMKSADTAFWVHDLTTPKGYKVEACIMAISKDRSWEGTIDRFLDQFENGEQARIVPPDFHDQVVDNIANAADEILKSGKMSNITVYNRGREIRYDMHKTPNLSLKLLLDKDINQSLERNDRTFVDLVSPDELKKLEDSGIPFEKTVTKSKDNAELYDNRIAVRFNFDLVEKVYDDVLGRPIPCDMSYLKPVELHVTMAELEKIHDSGIKVLKKPVKENDKYTILLKSWDKEKVKNLLAPPLSQGMKR